MADRLKAALPRMSLAVSIATLGISEFLFSLIARNRDEFPPGIAFQAWVLLWFQVLPAVLIWGADAILERYFGDGRILRAWRASLFTFVFLAVLRQVQLQLFDARGLARSQELLAMAGPWSLVAGPVLVAGVLWLLAWWKHRPLSLYFRLLGVLAAVLTLLFFWRTTGPGTARDSAPRAKSSESPPVLLLLFDELGEEILAPGGVWDREAFPHLAALSDDGLRLTDATTNFLFTNASVPSLLTGRLLPDAESSTVFRHAAGRVTTVVESWIWMENWLRKRDLPGDPQPIYAGKVRTVSEGPLDAAAWLAGVYFENLLPHRLRRSLMHAAGIPPSFHAFVFREAEAVATALSARPRGSLLFWHASIPHYPYALGDDGALHGDPADAVWAVGLDPARGRRNYVRQAKLADRLVGKIVAQLKTQGLYESAIIVVTGDHGPHTWDPYEPVGFPVVRSSLAAHVPLIIKAPGLPKIDPRLDYQHIDLAPTLLDLMGIPYAPEEFDGISLLSPNRPAREKVLMDAAYAYRCDPTDGLWRRIGPREAEPR